MKPNKKDILKRCLFLAFILVAITVVISIVVKYNVEGEKTLPFSIEKILVVSRVDTKNNEDSENLWNISLTENNNIFISIKKNDSSSNETIKNISLENFSITQKPTLGNIKIYRPTGDLNNLYEYSEQDYLNDKITYTGATVDTLKTLEIGNSGGMLGFRVALEDLGNYVSNNYDEEIKYDGSLLAKAGIAEDSLRFSLSFDILINLNSNVTFKGTLNIDLPNKDISFNPEAYLEINDFNNVIFKRIKN